MDKYKHIDLSYLELMSDGDVDMKGILLDMLLTEPDSEFKKMQELAAEQNWDELKQVSHKMKSTLPYIGFEELSETNKKIDKTLWERQGSGLPDEEVAQVVPILVDKASELYTMAVPELQAARNDLMDLA